MLSQHEFATLVLVSDNSDPTELDRADVEALLTHQLVGLQSFGPNHSRPGVTIEDYAFLQAVGRVRARDCWPRQASQCAHCFNP
ncbi:Preprotein translocase subunit SecA (plasmid) [Cupriavidus necator H16]|uniref:Uncharacterized protein n=1 Tax=Cupriavidus necator (strain ATCC 17699 / DSM 428 / KCTC 22496 / NCIMB 10442 / H16 / Stanier 337) TaxID=381666 RepID=A0AAE5ZMP7_CUPNH|nr:hypothetical protein [Cupriavidus necator]QCC05451.1 hypothetical protein E6A55_33255 [Cupriavidus necator H16]